MVIKIKKFVVLEQVMLEGPTMSVIADNCPEISVNVVDINLKELMHGIVRT